MSYSVRGILMSSREVSRMRRDSSGNAVPMNKAIWMLRQLLPLTYKVLHRKDGGRCLSVWKMWFGVVYNHKEYLIYEQG